MTVQLDINADKTYHTALEVVEHPPEKEGFPGFIKVAKMRRDDRNLSIEFDALFKDGTHHDKIKLTKVDAKRSRMVAVPDTPDDTKADESSALKIVKIVCGKLGVKYQVVKG